MSKKKNILANDRLEFLQSQHSGFVSPFDFLVMTMNGLDSSGNNIMVDLEDRIACAKAAIPYTNPKLAQTEITLDDDRELTDAEKKEKIVEILQRNPALIKLLTGEGGKDTNGQ